MDLTLVTASQLEEEFAKVIEKQKELIAQNTTNSQCLQAVSEDIQRLERKRTDLYGKAKRIETDFFLVRGDRDEIFKELNKRMKET